MANPWKRFEDHAARLFGTRRAWANSGARLDFPRFEELHDAPAVGQCKLVKALSLNELTALAEELESTAGPEQLGVVCVKVRRGRGCPSPALVVMTEGMWERLVQYPSILERIRYRRGIS